MSNSEPPVIISAPPPRKAKLSANVVFEESVKVTLLPDWASIAPLVVTKPKKEYMVNATRFCSKIAELLTKESAEFTHVIPAAEYLGLAPGVARLLRNEMFPKKLPTESRNNIAPPFLTAL